MSKFDEESEEGSCPNCEHIVHVSEMGEVGGTICCKHCYSDVKNKKEINL